MNMREVEEIGNEFAEKLSDGRTTDAMMLLMKLDKPLDAVAVLLWVWNETGVSTDEVREMARNWERLWEATKIVLERNAYHCVEEDLVEEDDEEEVMAGKHWCAEADELLESFNSGNFSEVRDALDAMPQDRAMAVVARVMDALTADKAEGSAYEHSWSASSFMRMLSDRLED
jgi:hypothetical protein